jgi:hypothetical protein
MELPAMAVLPLRPLMYLGRSITSPLKCFAAEILNAEILNAEILKCCHTEY